MDNNNRQLPHRPKAPWPPHSSRPMGIQKKEKRKEKEREKKEKEDKKRAAMRADILREIEEQEEEKKKIAAPKAPLTHAQQLRKEELLLQKDGFAAKFRAAKKKIKERKEVAATIAEAMEEAQKGQKEEKKIGERKDVVTAVAEALEEAEKGQKEEKKKKDLEKQYAEIIAELKPLDG